MSVTGKKQTIRRRIISLTSAIVLLTAVVTGTTTSFANTEKSTTDYNIPVAESLSPKMAATTVPKNSVTAPVNDFVTVNAIESPNVNDGFMVVIWLLLITALSTAVIIGLIRWIDPQGADPLDKVHFE